MDSTSEAIDLMWWTGPDFTIGLVAIINHQLKYWKLYIGTAAGYNKDSDIDRIRTLGVHAGPELAEIYKEKIPSDYRFISV